MTVTIKGFNGVTQNTYVLIDLCHSRLGHTVFRFVEKNIYIIFGRLNSIFIRHTASVFMI